jgi:Zn-dependent M28 family amino/carboxypeptidase
LIANLNLDMVGRSEDVPDPSNPRFRGLSRTSARDNANVLHLLGYSYSPDLAAVVKEENADIGLTLRTQYDNNAQDLVHRSDQWSFLERKIPAIFFTTGMHPDYHTPTDDVEKIEFQKMERIARLVYQVAWRVADQNAKPRYVDPGNR